MSIRRDLPAAIIPVRPAGRLPVASLHALERWHPGVRAVTGDGQGGEASISVLDVIGEDYWTGEGVTAKRVAAALRAIGDEAVTVNVNSPGGDYFEGLAIYNLLREHNGRVTVKVLGMAASAASIIAMAGDEIQIARAGFLMIHNTWILAAGDRQALRQAADWLEPFDALAADIYSVRSGQAVGAVAKMLDAETWIGGARAVEQGFADRLLPSDALAEDVEARARGEGLRAVRKLDNIAARADVPRSEIKELLRALTAMRGAGDPDDMRGAVDPSAEALAALRAELRNF